MSSEARDAEIEELKRRLAEAEDALRAIRAGEVDTTVGPEGQAFAHKGVELTYRQIVEQMNEGVLTFSPDGLILYCNRQFASMVGVPIEQLIGSSIYRLIPPSYLPLFQTLVAQTGHAELRLRSGSAWQMPAHVAVNRLDLEDRMAVVAIVTDLTAQRQSERIIANAELIQSIIPRRRRPSSSATPRG